MKLRLRREPTLLERVTFGDLYVYDGTTEGWQCFTLEDAVRAVKIKHKTAIPFGTYKLALYNSPKFGPETLHLLDVPNFDLVHIHSGNNENDTDGCILVGAKREGAHIYEAKTALAALKHLVVPELQAGREVYITIEPHTQESE